jgi:hypothetical protein
MILLYKSGSNRKCWKRQPSPKAARSRQPFKLSLLLLASLIQAEMRSTVALVPFEPDNEVHVNELVRQRKVSASRGVGQITTSTSCDSRQQQELTCYLLDRSLDLVQTLSTPGERRFGEEPR